MFKFHTRRMKEKHVIDTSPSATTRRPDGTVMESNVDGNFPNQAGGSTYGSYHTLSNDYPTRSVSVVSPVSKPDILGRANPGFLNDSTDDGGQTSFSDPNGQYPVKRPHSRNSNLTNRRSQYSPTEDRELPTYYMPVNAHRKLLRGEILYVTKDTRSSGRKCWRRCLCFSLIAVLLAAAIIIACLGGTGILFSRTFQRQEQIRNPSVLAAVHPAGSAVDIDAHEELISVEETSTQAVQHFGKIGVSREPKSEVDNSQRSTANNIPEQETISGGIMEASSDTTRSYETLPVENQVPEAVEGELRVVNMDFQPALADRKSWIFQYTANDLTVYMNDIFSKSPNAAEYNATRIVSFRPGSIIVKFQSLWNRAPANWDVEVNKTLNQHLDLNHNFIGNYLIDRGSLDVKSIFYSCRVDNGGCSHTCEFDLFEMRQYCLCPSIQFILVNSSTCVLRDSLTTTIPMTFSPILSEAPTKFLTLMSAPSSVRTAPSNMSTSKPIATSVTLMSTEPTLATSSLPPLSMENTTTSATISRQLVTEIIALPETVVTVTEISTTQPVVLNSTAAKSGNLMMMVDMNATIVPTLTTMTSNSTITVWNLEAVTSSASVIKTTAILAMNVTEVDNTTAASANITTTTGVTSQNRLDSGSVGQTTVENLPTYITTTAPSLTTSHLDDEEHEDSDHHLSTQFPSSHLLLPDSVITVHVIASENASVTPVTIQLSNVTVRHSVSCSANEYLCQHDDRCLPMLVRCNGNPECPDGSDEVNCTDCHLNFKCLSGNCIPQSLACDGIEDCSDGSDERACTQAVCQSSGMFQCVTGYCLENSSRCDGVGDCFAMGLPVDEMNCIAPNQAQQCTNAGHFICTQSRRCIPSSWRCNGRIDCLNSEDEFNCTCDRQTSFTCDAGGCIDISYRCNGIADCPDGYSDEVDCIRLPSNGLVQLRSQIDTWQNVCSDNWKQQPADSFCLQLGYRPSLSVYSQVVTENETNVYWLSPEFRPDFPIQRQVHRTTEENCGGKELRAGVTCERFRCQVLSDPDDDKKMISALAKISFTDDLFGSCSGVLVAPVWLLTSAGCIANRNASDMRATFISDGSVVNISDIQIHPLYLPVRMLHDRDVALLRLSTPLPATVLPVCLSTTAPPSLCKLVTFSSNGLSTAFPLQKIDVRDCNSKHNYVGLISGSMECWRGATVCDNDISSPLICENNMGDWELRGLLSYQRHCGLFAEKPLVMSNLTFTKSWMREIIGPSFDNVIRLVDPAVTTTTLAPVTGITWLPQLTKNISGAISANVTLNYDNGLNSTTEMTTAVLLTTQSTKPLEIDFSSIFLPSTSASVIPATVTITNHTSQLQNASTTSFATLFDSIFSSNSTEEISSMGTTVGHTSETISVPYPVDVLQCPDGTPLLHEFLCDGIFQCSDGWDEKLDHCMNIPCTSPDFQRCSNGRCLSNANVCDLKAQCPAGNTDEVGCSRSCDSATQFKCLEDRCIPLTWLCDGEKDCQIGEDETGEKCTSCLNSTDSFQCTYGGGCVSKKKVCDGFFDCPDYSDESSCVRYQTLDSNRIEVVEMRANGSPWAPVCLASVAGSQTKWAENICHEFGYDSSESSSGVFRSNNSLVYDVDTQANTDANLYLAPKNLTNYCDGNKVLSLRCRFNGARGKWNAEVRDLDAAVAYKVPLEEYRHIVLLLSMAGGDPCIGTIISSKWILTSHECIEQGDPEMVNWNWVVLVDPDAAGQDSTRFVRRFIPYPNSKFSVYFSSHDLLLVELMDAIDLQSGAKKAAIIPRQPLTLNATCITYGWLYSMMEISGTRIQRKTQGSLYFWKSPLVSQEHCNQVSSYNGLVRDDMICSGFRNATHRSPCMGRIDGAPLMCLNAENLWEITGVHSYQPACESAWIAPSVYADVYQHNHWISDLVGPYLDAL